MNRRDFLTATLTCLLGTHALSGCSAKKTVGSGVEKQLNVYSWPDYIAPEVIPEFEKRYGIKVVYDTVSTNEGLLAKFQAGASNYDVVVPSGYMVKQLKKLDLLQPIAHDKIPNFKHLRKRFTSSSFDPQCHYSVPYTFGTTGIAFSNRAFEKNPPQDWDCFWDKRAAGRMTLLDDPRETFGLALKHKGHSYNTTDAALLGQACTDMKAQKAYVMCYTSDQVIVYLASGDSLLSLVYSGDAQQAARQNSDINYTIPESGASVWVDSLCIPKSAPHPENAHLWINFIHEPEIAAAIANYTLYATPNETALKYMKPEILQSKGFYPPTALLDRCEEIDDVGQALFLYDRLWTELKCA